MHVLRSLGCKFACSSDVNRDPLVCKCLADAAAVTACTDWLATAAPPSCVPQAAFIRVDDLLRPALLGLIAATNAHVVNSSPPGSANYTFAFERLEMWYQEKLLDALVVAVRWGSGQGRPCFGQRRLSMSHVARAESKATLLTIVGQLSVTVFLPDEHGCTFDPNPCRRTRACRRSGRTRSLPLRWRLSKPIQTSS